MKTLTQAHEQWEKLERRPRRSRKRVGWLGHPDGHLERRWIRVEHHVGSEEAVREAMTQFVENTFVRVTSDRVLAPETRSGWWKPKGVTRLEKINGDLALEQAARELAKPVVVTDATLGRVSIQ